MRLCEGAEVNPKLAAVRAADWLASDGSFGLAGELRGRGVWAKIAPIHGGA